MSDEHKLVRAFPVEITETGDGRTLDVRIVPYNTPTRVADKPSNGGTGEPYIEEWLPGVFDGQTNAANRVDVLVNFEHEPGIGGVVGSGRQLWSATDGAYGSFRMLRTQDADKALELVNDKVVTGVSLEAIPIKSVRENGVVKRVKARLVNIALCRVAAFKEAEILAVREEPLSDPESEPEPEPVAWLDDKWVESESPDEESAQRMSPQDVRDEMAAEEAAKNPPEVSEAELALQRIGFEPLLVRAVVDRPWDGSPARFSDEQYERSALVCRPGDEPPKTRCSLPVLEPDGAVNRRALAAAAGRLNQTSLSPELRARAARKLMRLYRAADMEPPPNVVALASR
jgi:HK97 family phage prohead protease